MIQPLGSYVLVELMPNEKITSQGIVRVSSDVGQQQIVPATVVGVGAGSWQSGIFVEPKVEVGDVVNIQKERFRAHPGAPEGKEYVIGLEEYIWSKTK